MKKRPALALGQPVPARARRKDRRYRRILMTETAAPPHTARPLSEHPAHALQAVSLQDYEEVVTARACFLDFLLTRSEEQE